MDTHIGVGNRRRQRSGHPLEDMRYQIEYVARVLDLDAIVLADDLGFPLIQYGDRKMADLLAQSAMWTDRRGPDVDRFVYQQVKQLYPDYKRFDVVSRVMELPGMQSFCRLTAAGTSAARSVGLFHAAHGVERIYRNYMQPCVVL